MTSDSLTGVFFYAILSRYTRLYKKELLMKSTSLEYSEWLIDQMLYNSVQSIDARLGEGYHIKNPRLVCELTRLTYEEYKRQENLEFEETKEQEVLSYNFVKPSTIKKNKRPQFKFSSFEIPVGAELQCTLSPHIKCRVIDDTNGVLYNGEKTSMSAIINSLKGGSNRGPKYWMYRGKVLSDMVDENY